MSDTLPGTNEAGYRGSSLDELMSDAIGAESLPAYEASIHVNYPLLSNAVMEVDELLVALERPAGANLPQEPLRQPRCREGRRHVAQDQTTKGAGSAPGWN